jgi:hypothetical protein
MWWSADCRRPRLACSVLGVTACFSEVQNSCCAASWHHPPLKQVSGQCASLLHAHPPIGLVSFIFLYHIDIHRPCFIPLLVGLHNIYIYTVACTVRYWDLLRFVEICSPIRSHHFSQVVRRRGVAREPLWSRGGASASRSPGADCRWKGDWHRNMS